MKKISLFYFSSCIAFIISCNTQNQTKPTNYFDLTAYLNGQLKELYAQKFKLDKTSIAEDKSDMYSLAVVDWSRELQMFYNSDINKSGYDGKYSVDSIRIMKDTFPELKVTYSAIDSSLYTKQMEIYFSRTTNKVVYIRIKNSNHNFFVDNTTDIQYIPLTEIAINMRQKKLLGPLNEFKMRGVITHGSGYFQ